MSNLKKYNLFTLITSFTKLLVELFIPLILYEKGFSIKEIILFLIFKYAFCTLMIPITLKLGKKVAFTKIMLMSSLFFSITYIYLNFLKTSISSLIILALIFSIYLIFYWLGRHIFALAIIEDKKITDNVSLYSIFTILGGLPATYIGARILETFGFITLTIIVLVLMIISVIPLMKIKDVGLHNEDNIKNVVKTFPKSNYIYIILEQFRYIISTIFPIYIYLNIKKDLSYLGVINIICGIGSIIYIYILAKKMDKNKKDYFKVSSLLISIVYIFKITITNPKLFLIIIFFEGIMKSSLDTIVQRNTYAYGKNYDAPSYISFIELLNNITRTLFLIIFFILDLSLKQIIIFSIFGIIVNAFIKFDDGKYGYCTSH